MIPIPAPLKPIFNFLIDVFRALSSYTPGILAVLLSYFILVNIEQGRDVIIQIGEYPWTGIVSVIAVFCWAYFLWYSTRLLGYQNETLTTFINAAFYHHPPRLIAFMGLAVIQVSILSLPTISFLNEFPSLKKDYADLYAPMLLVFHVVIYAAISSFFQVKKMWWRVIVVVLVFAYGVFSIMHAGTDEPTYRRHVLWLPIISTIVFMLQIAGLVYITIRKNNVARSGKLQYLIVSLGKWQLYRIGPMDGNTAKFERLFFRTFNWLFFIAAVYFIVLVSSLNAAVLAGPFTILIVAFIIIFGSTNFLAFIATKLKMNLLIVMIVVAVIAGKLYPERYVIQLPEAKNPKAFESRQTLREYFHTWIDAKRAKIQPYKKYPVYIILSDGGASRSAYWVASVLSAWQDRSDSIPDNKFSDHLFALSGASGGSVGNATFYALLDDLNHEPRKFEMYSRATNFLYNDFLSFSIATYVGLDLTGNFIPFLSSRDRAEAIELGLIEASKLDNVNMHGSFGKMLSEFIPTKAELPILFMNVTEVQEGMPAVVSNIKLDGFSQRLDILKDVDALKKDISLSTAAMLSARFPYISPAGRIGNRYYVDGGYFDNSGAGVVHEMLQAIHLIMKEGNPKYKDIYEKLEFHVVHVSNTPLTKSELKGIHPLANDLAAPVITVLSTYNSQTVVNDARLQVFLKEWNQHMDPDMNLYDANSGNFPMSWVISDYNLFLMDQRLLATLPELRKKYATLMEEVVVADVP